MDDNIVTFTVSNKYKNRETTFTFNKEKKEIESIITRRINYSYPGAGIVKDPHIEITEIKEGVFEFVVGDTTDGIIGNFRFDTSTVSASKITIEYSITIS
jgi:hypothetical protein